MACDGAHVNSFQNLEGNIRLSIDQIKDGESEKEAKEHFNSDLYWSHLGTVYKALSHEGTKLSLAFMKAPFPSDKECAAMTASMEALVLELVSTFYSFPKTQGLTLRRILQQSVLQILSSVLGIATCLAQPVPGGGDRQQATGIVWEGANNFTHLPQNNRDAVIHKLDESSGLVEDALAEVDEILNNDGRLEDIFDDLEGEDEEDHSNTWTDQDRLMVAPVKGLIKTATKVLKKGTESCNQRGHCDAIEHIVQLDGLSDCTQQLSPAVDNLISSLYAPVDHTSVISNAIALSEVADKLLSILRHSHMTVEEDSKWLDFLHKANKHNLATLIDLLNK